MADNEHLKILKQGVAIWNQWRKKNHRLIPDLSGTDLIGVDFSGVDLSGTNLSGADLSRADLSGANLSRADLSDADLRGADLSKADLSIAVLTKANLNAADLSMADLSDAQLFDANLTDADLSGADLSDANLTLANLTLADLSYVDLSGADLILTKFIMTDISNADLRKAVVTEAIFVDANLKDTKGLDKCRHTGPSTVDHRTLQRSGSLPKEFLRGCGLPDNLIEAMLSALKESQYYSAFISYSHDDKDFALKLESKLKAEGVLCWLDEHKMLPGDDKYEEVDRGIYGWDKFLLCCSKSSLTSWWVDSEINKAFTKEQKLTKERSKKIKCLIPLDLDGYIFADGCRIAKKDEILSRIAADFTGWNKDEKKFEKELNRVLKALRLDDGGREMPPEPKL